MSDGCALSHRIHKTTYIVRQERSRRESLQAVLARPHEVLRDGWWVLGWSIYCDDRIMQHFDILRRHATHTGLVTGERSAQANRGSARQQVELAAGCQWVGLVGLTGVEEEEEEVLATFPAEGVATATPLCPA